MKLMRKVRPKPCKKGEKLGFCGEFQGVNPHKVLVQKNQKPFVYSGVIRVVRSERGFHQNKD
jgi:hypothetical protein